MQYYVGIDHHKRTSYLTVMDKRGTILKQNKMNTAREDVREHFKEYSGAKAVLEAGRNWHVMYDWLKEEGLDVVLAHPQKVKAIAEAKIKNDKIDSRTLAHLLRADLIPEAHVPDKNTREAKKILRQRMFLVRLQTMLKNRIRILLEGNSEIYSNKPVKGLFTQKGLEWMKGLSLSEKDKEVLKNDIDLLGELKNRIEQSDNLVEKLYKEDQKARYLKSIPGIGEFFAVLISNEIDDIDRFKTKQKLASYCGLIPSTYSSGTRTVHGRMTKRGNKWLRYALIEAVWPAIRTDEELRSYYEKRKKYKAANVAKVATARRLLEIVYRVLKEERYYKISRRLSFFSS
jgi:transposase